MSEKDVKDALNNLIHSSLPIDSKVILLLGLFYVAVQEKMSNELKVEILREFSKIYEKYKKISKELEMMRKATGNGFSISIGEHLK